jgi:Icc-related predicted phosphoesterase
MRIQYFSDLHLGHEFYFKKSLTHPEAVASICVIAGDIWEGAKEFKFPIKKPWMHKLADNFEHVLFVLGNHDYYNHDIQNIEEVYRNFANKVDNIHFLQKDIVEIDGIKFVGCTLWTDFLVEDNYFNKELKLNDFYCLNDANCIFNSNNLVKPENILNIHNDHKHFLNDNVDSNTVVITHHVPSYRAMHEKWKTSTISHLFYSNLEALILDKTPRAWIAGHTHDSFDLTIGNTRLVGNPRGYSSGYGVENSNFDWQKTIEV